MITENKSFTRTGIPLLCDIPILGNLFGYTTVSKKKTELIILITPRVIGNIEDAKRISEDFENKVKGLKKLWGK